MGEHGIPFTIGIVVFELVVGVACGLAAGFGGAWLMRRAALPASGLYPIAVLTLAFLAYGAAAFVHASGFAAVYVAALVLGNSELPHRGGDPVVRGGRGLAGPDRAVRDARAAALPGSDLVGGRRARPARGPDPHGAGAAHLGARQLDRETAARGASSTFLSWAGLRGAVPIVLMTIPLAEGVDGRPPSSSTWCS